MKFIITLITAVVALTFSSCASKTPVKQDGKAVCKTVCK
jgi:hypothetical protein